MSKGSRRLVVAGVAVFALAALHVCTGFWFPGLDIALYLPIAWAFFLKRVGPQLSVRWDLVASTAVYALALLVGSHLFLRWLYREWGKAAATPAGDAGAAPRRWKWRWTFGGFAVVFLMFVAGTAAVGIVHQTVWLARSPDRIYHRRGRGEANRIKCASNLRQIGLAIEMYANQHGGKLPDDFGALLLNTEVVHEVFVCPTSQDEPPTGQTAAERAASLSTPGHCSYAYFGRGLSMPVDANRVMAMDKPENHGLAGTPGRAEVNVLYGDGRVEWVAGKAAEKLLTELDFERTERGWREPAKRTAATGPVAP
jgi:hypothetical protein